MPLFTTGYSTIPGVIEATFLKHQPLVPWSPSTCWSKELTAIRKHLLFQWTPNHTLKGLMVDNYEAMTVVAPEALGYLTGTF